MTDAPARPKRRYDAETAELARLLGISQGDMHVAQENWSALLRDGVIVSLHMGRWRGVSPIDLTDLGLDVSSERFSPTVKLMKLGKKLLMPPEWQKKLDTIESGARQHVNSKGIRTTFGQLWHVGMYQEAMDKLENFRERWEATAFAAFGVREVYLDWRFKLMEEYEQYAYGLHDELSKSLPDSVFAKMTAEEFVMMYCERVEEQIPDHRTIMRSFYLRIDQDFIPLPSMMAGELAASESIKTASTAERIRMQAEAELKASELRLKTAEVDLKVMQETDALTVRERMLRDMNAKVVEESRVRFREEAAGAVKQAVVEMQSLLYDAATNVVAAIDTGWVHPRQIGKLRNAVSGVNALNLWMGEFGSEEVAKLARMVAKITDANPSSSDLEGARKMLADIATVTRGSLVQLSDTFATDKKLVLADVDPIKLNRARRDLNLDGKLTENADLPLIRQARILNVE